MFLSGFRSDDDLHDGCTIVGSGKLRRHHQAYVYRVVIDPVNMVASQCPALRYSLTSNALPKSSAFSTRQSKSAKGHYPVIPQTSIAIRQELCPNLQTLLLIADGKVDALRVSKEVVGNESPISGLPFATLHSHFATGTVALPDDDDDEGERSDDRPVSVGRIKDLTLYAYGKIPIAQGIYTEILGWMTQYKLFSGLQQFSMLGTNDLAQAGGSMGEVGSSLVRRIATGAPQHLRNMYLSEMDGGKGSKLACKIQDFIGARCLEQLALPQANFELQTSRGFSGMCLEWGSLWRLQSSVLNDAQIISMASQNMGLLRYCDFNGTGGRISDAAIAALVEAGARIHHLSVSFCGGVITNESICKLYAAYDMDQQTGRLTPRKQEGGEEVFIDDDEKVVPFKPTSTMHLCPALRSLRSLDVGRTGGRITERAIINLLNALDAYHGQRTSSSSSPSSTSASSNLPPPQMLTAANKDRVGDVLRALQGESGGGGGDVPWSFQTPRYDGAPTAHMLQWSEEEAANQGAARVAGGDLEMIQGYLASEPCVSALIERIIAHPQTQCNPHLLQFLTSDAGSQDMPMETHRTDSDYGTNTSAYTTRTSPHDPRCFSRLRRRLTPATTPVYGLRQLFVNFNTATAASASQTPRDPCFTDALLDAICHTSTRWTLTALDVSATNSIGPMSSHAILNLAKSCPNLRYLNIEKCMDHAHVEGGFFAELRKALHPHCILIYL